MNRKPSFHKELRSFKSGSNCSLASNTATTGRSESRSHSAPHIRRNNSNTVKKAPSQKMKHYRGSGKENEASETASTNQQRLPFSTKRKKTRPAHLIDFAKRRALRVRPNRACTPTGKTSPIKPQVAVLRPSRWGGVTTDLDKNAGYFNKLSSKKLLAVSASPKRRPQRKHPSPKYYDVSPRRIVACSYTGGKTKNLKTAPATATTTRPITKFSQVGHRSPLRATRKPPSPQRKVLIFSGHRAKEQKSNNSKVTIAHEGNVKKRQIIRRECKRKPDRCQTCKKIRKSASKFKPCIFLTPHRRHRGANTDSLFCYIPEPSIAALPLQQEVKVVPPRKMDPPAMNSFHGRGAFTVCAAGRVDTNMNKSGMSLDVSSGLMDWSDDSSTVLDENACVSFICDRVCNERPHKLAQTGGNRNYSLSCHPFQLPNYATHRGRIRENSKSKSLRGNTCSGRHGRKKSQPLVVGICAVPIETMTEESKRDKFQVLSGMYTSHRQTAQTNDRNHVNHFENTAKGQQDVAADNQYFKERLLHHHYQQRSLINDLNGKRKVRQLTQDGANNAAGRNKNYMGSRRPSSSMLPPTHFLRNITSTRRLLYKCRTRSQENLMKQIRGKRPNEQQFHRLVSYHELKKNPRKAAAFSYTMYDLGKKKMAQPLDNFEKPRPFGKTDKLLATEKIDDAKAKQRELSGSGYNIATTAHFLESGSEIVHHKDSDVGKTINEEMSESRFCDKMKSHKWRQRHEPYKVSLPSKKIVTKVVSPFTTSEGFYTQKESTQDNSVSQGNDDFGLLPNQSKTAGNLFMSSQFVDSDQPDDKVSFDTNTGESPQNKNNCSPSRRSVVLDIGSLSNRPVVRNDVVSAVLKTDGKADLRPEMVNDRDKHPVDLSKPHAGRASGELTSRYNQDRNLEAKLPFNSPLRAMSRNRIGMDRRDLSHLRTVAVEEMASSLNEGKAARHRGESAKLIFDYTNKAVPIIRRGTQNQMDVTLKTKQRQNHRNASAFNGPSGSDTKVFHSSENSSSSAKETRRRKKGHNLSYVSYRKPKQPGVLKRSRVVVPRLQTKQKTDTREVRHNFVNSGVQTSVACTANVAVQTSPCEEYNTGYQSMKRRNAIYKSFIPRCVQHKTTTKPRVKRPEGNVREQSGCSSPWMDARKCNGAETRTDMPGFSTQCIREKILTINDDFQHNHEEDTLNNMIGITEDICSNSFHERQDTLPETHRTESPAHLTATSESKFDSTNYDYNMLSTEERTIALEESEQPGDGNTPDFLERGENYLPEVTSSTSSPIISKKRNECWMIRPRWEDANVDELNRRVERALRLRHELRMKKANRDKFPDPSPVTFDKLCKPSSSTHLDMPVSDRPTTQIIPKSLTNIHGLDTPTKCDGFGKRELPPTPGKTLTPVKTSVNSPFGQDVSLVSKRDISSNSNSHMVVGFPSSLPKPPMTGVDQNTHPLSLHNLDLLDSDLSSSDEVECQLEENKFSTKVPREMAKDALKAKAGVGSEFMYTQSNNLSNTVAGSNSPSSVNAYSHVTIASNYADFNHDITAAAAGVAPASTKAYEQPAGLNISPPIKIPRKHSAAPTSSQQPAMLSQPSRLVGELVQALPQVPLSSFVEWFIETSHPEQFIYSTEESPSSDKKGAANDGRFTTTNNNSASVPKDTGCPLIIISQEQGESQIFMADRNQILISPKVKYSHQSNQPEQCPLPDNPDIETTTKPSAAQNLDRNKDGTAIKDNEQEGDVKVSSIRRIFLSSKRDHFSDCSAQNGVSPGDNRRIITIRQTGDPPLTTAENHDGNDEDEHQQS